MWVEAGILKELRIRGWPLGVASGSLRNDWGSNEIMGVKATDHRYEVL